jgi:hypothetical protein
MERPRRGRTVAGTSAKKQRILRRQNRLDSQRTREGAINPPEDVTAADDLEEIARRLRGLPPAEEECSDDREEIT